MCHSEPNFWDASLLETSFISAMSQDLSWLNVVFLSWKNLSPSLHNRLFLFQTLKYGELPLDSRNSADWERIHDAPCCKISVEPPRGGSVWSTQTQHRRLLTRQRRWGSGVNRVAVASQPGWLSSPSKFGNKFNSWCLTAPQQMIYQGTRPGSDTSICIQYLLSTDGPTHRSPGTPTASSVLTWRALRFWAQKANSE